MQRDKYSENIMITSSQFREEREYWTAKLQGDVAMSTIPLDEPRTKPAHYKAGVFREKITAGIHEKIMSISKNSDYAVFMILLAGVVCLLRKYTGSEDIVVGMPAFTRKDGNDIDNILPLRTQAGGKISFKELLFEIRKTVNDADKYINLPFARIAELTGINISDDSLPVFGIIVLMNGIHNKKGVAGINADLVFEFSHRSSALEITIAYNADLYSTAKIGQAAVHLGNIYRAAVNQPDLLLAEIDLLTQCEKDRILKDFNNTKAGYPKEKTIPAMFEEQAAGTPDRLAAVCGNSSLSYAELNRRSNQLAMLLREKGVKPDTPVGIMLERSLEMIVGIMAVLKAGGAYLPLDPHYPGDRIKYMLQDSGVRILLTGQELPDQAGFNCETIDIRDHGLYAGKGENPVPVNKPGDLAYVIYTSGSSGKPKGVLIEHYSVVNRLHWMQKRYPLCARDMILQKTPFTFDVSVWEMFWWGFNGAGVCFLAPGDEKVPAAIAAAVAQYRITNMHFVPSMLNVFLEYLEGREKTYDLTSLRRVFASGEALLPEQVKRFNRVLNETFGTTLHNLYGPTEATVDVSYFDCPADSEPVTVPIGKPIDNTGLYIVNQDRQLQPVGIPGELCIAGDGLARGYLGKPELTAEKFVPDPFAASGKMYRTGDLARWNPDGNIEYLGRIDHQVKIRGNRIELGEIETVLLKSGYVKEVVVTAREDKADSKYLCAYLVMREDGAIAGLKAHLEKALPEYMIPSFFVQLDRMPVTANGKIDRKALPKPDTVLSADNTFEAPGNAEEEILAGIWQEVLDITVVSINDSFFHIGGDSIKVISLLNRINRELNINAQMKDVYAHPTLKKLALFISENREQKPESDLDTGLKIIEEFKQNILKNRELAAQLPAGYEDFYPLSQIQMGMIFHSVLKSELPVYHDQFPFVMKFKEFDPDVLRKALSLLMQRHPMLRTTLFFENFSDSIQVVHKKIAPEVYLEDLSGFSLEDKQLRITKRLKEDVERRYKFGMSLLWRIMLFKLDNENYCTVLSSHHSILDGWSVALFSSELMEIYDVLTREGAYEIKTLQSSYKDYVAINLSRKVSEKAVQFWKEALKDFTRTRLPFNSTGRILNNTGDNGIFNTDLGSELYGAIEVQARKLRCTAKDICLSAFIFLLNVLTTEEDIVTGVVTHDRPIVEDSDKIVGCFLNTLPVRVKMDTAGKKTELTGMVKEYLYKAKAHELFLGDIAALVGEANESGNPIFDIIFNYTDFHVMQSVQALDTINQTNVNLNIRRSEMTNTFLDFELSKTTGNFFLQIKYAPQYLSADEITRACRLYKRALRIFAEDEDFILSPELLLEAGEKERLLREYNKTDAEYDRSRTIQELFEARAALTPESAALVFKDKSYTYRELNSRANRLAAVLREKGVKAGSITGVLMPRIPELVAAILGILKAGGAYLPLDPAYPAGRIKYMLEDSRAGIVVTAGIPLSAYDIGTGIINMDTLEPATADFMNPVKANTSQDPAYVIYTSGSTGTPKGVMIEHNAIHNFINGMAERINFAPGKRILALTTVSFDIFVLETLLPLARGMTIVLAGEEEQQDPEMLNALIEKNGINMLQTTPSRFKMLLNSGDAAGCLSRLSEIMVGGESFPVHLLDTLNKICKGKIYNLYGPTETTVWSTVQELTGRDRVDIGKPIANTRVFVVDKNNRLVPEGVTGELCIAGAGLARGYYNKPELTAERFVSNPFRNGEPETVNYDRMYKTGDIARWLPDGNLECLGRVDHQVKIRGFRIEPGEIESLLLKHRQIWEAVVDVRKDGTGGNSLCAYLVADAALKTGEIREYLAGMLPDYMVPGFFVKLEKLPLTPNGKVNRKELPAPDTDSIVGTECQPPSAGPETLLASIWQEVLGLNRVGANDPFFNIGGDSIKAVLVAAKAGQNGLRISIRDIIQHRTITNIIKNMSGQPGYNTGNDDEELELY